MTPDQRRAADELLVATAVLDEALLACPPDCPDDGYELLGNVRLSRRPLERIAAARLDLAREMGRP